MRQGRGKFIKQRLRWEANTTVSGIPVCLRRDVSPTECLSLFPYEDSLSRNHIFFHTVYPFWSGSDIICDLFFQTRKKNPAVHSKPEEKHTGCTEVKRVKSEQNSESRSNIFIVCGGKTVLSLFFSLTMKRLPLFSESAGLFFSFQYLSFQT